MKLINIIKNRFKRDSVSFAAGSGSGICGPGMHRHPDVYHDKCHPIEQHHRGTYYKPNEKTPGDKTREIPKPKKHKVKKLQLGRPL